MNRTSTSARAVTLLACSLGMLLLGCQQSSIQLGVVLPITGDWKLYGDPIQKGIEIAFEEIQADGSYPSEIALVFKDTESDPTKAKEFLEEVFKGGAIAAIGGATSAEAKEMISVADKYDRVLLSPTASSPELTGISKLFYRIYPSDYLEANKMADFAARKLKIESVVVLAQEGAYAGDIQEVLKEQFNHFEVEVLDVISFPANTDFSGLVDRAVSLAPKAIYLAAYADTTGSLIKALRAAEFEGRILTTSAFDVSSEIARTGEDAVDVLLTKTEFDVDSEHAHIKTFVAAYQEKYGEEPGLYAAYGYDSLKVLAEALKGRKAISLEVPKGLRSISDFPGVMGSIRFDDNGDVTRYPRVYTINEDLVLYNYDAHVEKQKEELLKRMRELQNQARSLKNNG